MKFQLGEVVRLKTGGSLMTIEKISDDLISCAWFDTADHLQRDSFRQECLKRVFRSAEEQGGDL